VRKAHNSKKLYTFLGQGDDVGNKDEKKFNIQLAAQMTGLTAHTIRAWEKRYQALSPERTNNGRRLYSSRSIG
jgi:hypothetical protein